MSGKTWGRVVRGLALAMSAGVALSLTSCDQEKTAERASEPLLQAFQTGCSTSKGRWTDEALAQSRSLVQTFKTLKDLDPCKGLVTQLAAIQNYSSSINQLLEDDAFRALRTKEESLTQLTLALAETTDPALQAALQTAIVSTQVEIAQARADSFVARGDNKSDRLRTASDQLVSYTQGMLNNTGDLNACLREHPEVGVEIANNLITMGASLVSPIYGAGARLIGGLINMGIESARTGATEDAIYNLYQVQMPASLTCAMEAMTELHCQASETYELVQMQADHNGAVTPGVGDAWKGLNLYGDDVPHVVNWLRELRNGQPPADEYAAARRNDASRKRDIINYADQSYQGRISQLIRTVTGTVDPGVQISTLLDYVTNGAFGLTGAGSSGSTTESSLAFSGLTKNPNQMACWLVVGYGDARCNEVPSDSIPSPSTVEAYVRRELLRELTSNFRGLGVSWTSLVNAAARRADIEYLDAIAIDVQATFQKAKESSGTHESPVSVLREIVEFLDLIENSPRTPAHRLPLLRQTRKDLVDAIRLIEAPEGTPSRAIFDNEKCAGLPTQTPGAGRRDDYKDRLACLYNLFQLKDGTQYFVERVGNFVLWELVDRLKDGSIGTEIAAILSYLGGDLRARLLAPGNESLQAVTDDLAGAREITEGNLEVFRSFFKNSLGKAVRDRAERARPPLESPIGANRPNGQLLGKLCAFILVTGKDDAAWPAEVPWELCQSASYYYPGDPARTPHFTLAELRTELQHAPPMQQTRNWRMCGYHRFLRQTRIREILHGEPPVRRDPTPNPMGFSLPEGLLRFLTPPNLL